MLCFQSRMGNSEMQIGWSFIACVSLLETLFRSRKRKKPLGYLLYVQYNLCCMQGACTTFSSFYSFKQQFHSFIVLAGLSAGSHSNATLNCSQKKTINLTSKQQRRRQQRVCRSVSKLCGITGCLHLVGEGGKGCCFRRRQIVATVLSPDTRFVLIQGQKT